MEAFESFVALALEAEDFVISGPIKFKIKKKTKNTKLEVHASHGYEVDLIAARADKLVLVSVKGFFGSDGVRPNEVLGTVANSSGYKMLNDVELRNQLVKLAAEKFGYRESQVEMRLYGGKFKYGDKGLTQVREWASKQKVGGGPITVFSGTEISSVVVELAKSKTYRDHEVLMTVKVLVASGLIKDGDTTEVKQPNQVSSKKSSTGHQPLAEVVKLLPVGMPVRSTKDGLKGVVLGHKQDPGKAAYVRLWVDGEDKNYLRAATTLLSMN
jgi:hypothetical protein